MEEEQDLDQFNLSLKKKKKKKIYNENNKNNEIDEKDEKQEYDYDYTHLLERLYTNLRHNNSNIINNKKLVIPPPSVIALSSKKTLVSNFFEIIRIINRNIEHVQSFFITELNSNCNIDSLSRLIIKGKYSQRQVESIFKKYITDYVICDSCKKSNTYLLKDQITRLYFLNCDSCKSTKSVQPIKNGFNRI